MVINSKTITNKITHKNIDNHEKTRNMAEIIMVDSQKSNNMIKKNKKKRMKRKVKMKTRKITKNSRDYLKKKILKKYQKKKKSNIYNSSKTLYKNPRKL